MSTAVLSQNATDLAATGFNVDQPDSSRIRAIVLANAATKHGGYTFQPGVLFTKVCKEIKSLAGLNKGAMLPENVAKLINDEVNKLPVEIMENLNTSGYKLLKTSGEKINVSSREMCLTRRVIGTYEKLTSLEDQEKDMKWLLFTLEEKKNKLNLVQFRDMEHRNRVEQQIVNIEKKLASYKRLHRSIKMEIEEQRKAIEK